jgi:hypothetical protein
MQKIKAGYHKWSQRPKYGLQLRILRQFMSEQEIETLIFRYMVAKQVMMMEALHNNI